METPTNSEREDHPRGDDRNEELDESPAPDPEEGPSDADDVPEAD